MRVLWKLCTALQPVDGSLHARYSDGVAAWCNASVLCNWLCCTIYDHCLVHLRSTLWCVLCACTNITKKERKAFSPFVKALHWVTFCWTFSVCATYRLCRHLVHHKCATSYVSCCALLCAILREQYTEGGSLFALRVCCEFTHILLLMFCIGIYSMVIFWYAQQCECVMHDVCLLSSEKW